MGIVHFFPTYSGAPQALERNVVLLDPTCVCVCVLNMEYAHGVPFGFPSHGTLEHEASLQTRGRLCRWRTSSPGSGRCVSRPPAVVFRWRHRNAAPFLVNVLSRVHELAGASDANGKAFYSLNLAKGTQLLACRVAQTVRSLLPCKPIVEQVPFGRLPSSWNDPLSTPMKFG